MDGPLLLTRVVRKVTIGFELIDGQGDSSSNQVECLSSEQTLCSLLGILCRPNCKEPHHGQDLDVCDFFSQMVKHMIPFSSRQGRDHKLIDLGHSLFGNH